MKEQRDTGKTIRAAYEDLDEALRARIDAALAERAEARRQKARLALEDQRRRYAKRRKAAKRARASRKRNR